MYILEQRQQKNWHQAAALLMLLQGQLGAENFAQILQQCRPQLMAQIGVDGFDYLLPLLVRAFHLIPLAWGLTSPSSTPYSER